MLCNSIILYICAVVNTTMILHIKEKAFSWFLCQRKVEIIYTHIEQTIRLTVYAVGVSCLCVRASTPSPADRQMPYRFFMLTRLQHWAEAVRTLLTSKASQIEQMWKPDGWNFQLYSCFRYISAGMPMNRTFAERLKLLKDFWGHSSREGYFSSKDGYAYQKEGGKTLKTCRKMSQFL